MNLQRHQKAKRKHTGNWWTKNVDPPIYLWKFKIHNGVTAVLDFHQRLADKLLLKFEVVTSLDKYLPLICTASDSTEIWKGSQSGPEGIILKLQLNTVVSKEPRLDSTSWSLCCCCFLMSMSRSLCLQPWFSLSLKAFFTPLTSLPQIQYLPPELHSTVFA